MNETLEQLSALENEDLVNVYFSSIKVLKDRGIYNATKRKLNQYKNRATKPTEHCIPITSKNKKYNLSYQKESSVLIDILMDDWSYLFDGEYDESTDYYVYYHTRPYCLNMRFYARTFNYDFAGEPFYIGKGKGDRYKSFKRNRVHEYMLKNLNDSCFDKDDICHLFEDGLTEKEALILESKLITFFGCKNEIRKKWLTGRYGGMLINTDYGKRPDWIDEHIKTINKS